MKKKILIPIIAAAAVFAAAAAPILISEPDTEKVLSVPSVRMYSPDGEETTVLESERKKYEEEGWYDEPVKELYAADGTGMYVKHSEIADYMELGWLDRKPEAEGLEPLKEEISSYISKRSGEWGVFIQSLPDNEYLLINEKKYSSASLIKLFTMAAVYNELECGTFEKTQTVQDELRLMIDESSNTACNELTRRLGGGRAIRGFEVENKNTQSLGCENTSHGSELVDGRGKVTFTGFNTTSPRDCGRILYKIYYGDLVSDTASREMFELLKAQERTWKIPASLPEGTVTANKTGETDTVQADAAMVFSPARDYIICVIGSGNVSIETIQEISRITYRYFNPEE